MFAKRKIGQRIKGNVRSRNSRGPAFIYFAFSVKTVLVCNWLNTSIDKNVCLHASMEIKDWQIHKNNENFGGKKKNLERKYLGGVLPIFFKKATAVNFFARIFLMLPSLNGRARQSWLSRSFPKVEWGKSVEPNPASRWLKQHFHFEREKGG